MIFYLIYVSQAERPVSPSELTAILDKSRRNNRRDGITGLIIYKLSPKGDAAFFMQLLEGDEHRVRQTYQRIVDDPRHHTKVVLEKGNMEARSFPNWLMGLRNLQPGALAEAENFADLGEERFWTRAKAGEIADALGVMRQFYESDS